jgi:hypothetical protein
MGASPPLSRRFTELGVDRPRIAFSEGLAHRQVEEKQKRIEFLEKKVQTKDEVLAELMAEHIALKKSLGEL